MSYTVTIPGGTAELLDASELTPRRQRAVQVIALMAGPALKKINNAAKLTLPDGTVKENPDALDGMPDVELTEAEAELFFKIQDASIYANLKSWTLTNPDGTPMARPETVDAVQDIPGPVYDAISAAINAPAAAGDVTAGATASFEPTDASVADPASPFGNSGDSAASSPETAPLI
jgi:hypothetical protein